MITLSSHQKEQIALATLALERNRVGVFSLNRSIVGAEGWQVGVSVPSAGSDWPNKLVTIAVVNHEEITEYTKSIEIYLNELYTERDNR